MVLKRCVRCLLPETYETIEFGEDGVCNICRNHEVKAEIDWEVRESVLRQIIDKHRGKSDYDCIVPFSGGKDSTYTLWHLVTYYKVKPLVIQFDHGFMRPNLLENNRRTFKKLGVDVMSFQTNWKVVKRLMLESLKRKGDFCWHCHTGIFAFPMQMAIKFGVPLVIWGEPSAEYTQYYGYDELEEVDETRFNRFVNLGITAKDMAGMISGDFALDERDLKPYTYPALRDLKQLKYRSICLGSYIPWNTRSNYALIMRELGWSGDEVEGMPSGMWPYEKIECQMQGVRDYIKYLKRGYSRVSQMVALDLRNRRITPDAGFRCISPADAGLRMIEGNEGKKPHSLKNFLSFFDMSENEFNDIVLKTVVPPHKPEFGSLWSPKTWDFDQWYKE